MKFHQSNYFIDWVSVNIPYSPYSLTSRGYEWNDEQHGTYYQFLEDSCSHHFNKTFRHRVLHERGIKPWNIFHKKKNLSFEFRGSYFEGKSIKDDLNDFWSDWQDISNILRYNGKI